MRYIFGSKFIVLLMLTVNDNVATKYDKLLYENV